MKNELETAHRPVPSAPGRPPGSGASWRKSRRGASLLEMAFLVPVLMLLLVAVIDFGRAYYLTIELANAAEAGALYGANNPGDTTGMQNAATTDAPDVPGITATATMGCECSDGTSAQSPCPATAPTCSVNVVNFVQVTTTATYNTLFHYPGIPSSFALTGKSKMRE